MAVTAIVRFALPEDKTRAAAKAAFEASAPLYQGVQGLIRKYHLLSEDGRTGGGVYLFESREDAERLYDAAWRAGIRERLGATDRAIGLVDRFASCFSDGRTASRVVHDVATLVGQRVFGIALGYEDLIDHDALRHDPVLGVVLGRLEARRPGCAPLAGKSTLNRLEHAPQGAHRYRRIGHDGARSRRSSSISSSTPTGTRLSG